MEPDSDSGIDDWGLGDRMRMIENRLVLAVRNLNASATFYRDVFGCRDVGPDASTGWNFLSNPGSPLN